MDIPLLNERDASRLLGLSLATLRRRRAQGSPPRYVKFGRLVRYRRADLASFVTDSLANTGNPKIGEEREPRMLPPRERS